MIIVIIGIMIIVWWRIENLCACAEIWASRTLLSGEFQLCLNSRFVYRSLSGTRDHGIPLWLFSCVLVSELGVPLLRLVIYVIGDIICCSCLECSSIIWFIISFCNAYTHLLYCSLQYTYILVLLFLWLVVCWVGMGYLTLVSIHIHLLFVCWLVAWKDWGQSFVLQGRV